MLVLSADGWLYSGWARLFSFLCAAALSVLILVFPTAVADSIGSVDHGRLSLLMWGMAAGYVHGVGFDPHYWLWRLVFGPWAAWPLMLMGIAWLLAEAGLIAL